MTLSGITLNMVMPTDDCDGAGLDEGAPTTAGHHGPLLVPPPDGRHHRGVLPTGGQQPEQGRRRVYTIDMVS